MSSKKIKSSKNIGGIGSTIDGRYKIISCISKDVKCLNKVYKVQDDRDMSYAALKIINIKESIELKEYKNEIEILSSIDHPGIIKLLDSKYEDRKAHMIF